MGVSIILSSSVNPFFLHPLFHLKMCTHMQRCTHAWKQLLFASLFSYSRTLLHVFLPLPLLNLTVAQCLILSNKMFLHLKLWLTLLCHSVCPVFPNHSFSQQILIWAEVQQTVRCNEPFGLASSNPSLFLLASYTVPKSSAHAIWTIIWSITPAYSPVILKYFLDFQYSQ